MQNYRECLLYYQSKVGINISEAVSSTEQMQWLL
jgi:hypothetical protein